MDELLDTLIMLARGTDFAKRVSCDAYRLAVWDFELGLRKARTHPRLSEWLQAIGPYLETKPFAAGRAEIMLGVFVPAHYEKPKRAE